MATKTKNKPRPPSRTNTEIRRLLLQYFYDRNKNATSDRGKNGAAVRISDVKKDLKVAYGLTQQDVQSNLTYLISQGWVERETVEKSFTAPGGTVMPSTTSFHRITADGIDKIEGAGEFTNQKFRGINISATGSIVTVGDGNQINAKFGDLGQALAELQEAVTSSKASDPEKLAVVADIDTIQTQLAKPQPNKSIVAAAWSAIKGAAAVGQFVGLVERVTGYIGDVLS